MTRHGSAGGLYLWDILASSYQRTCDMACGHLGTQLRHKNKMQMHHGAGMYVLIARKS